MSRFWRTIVGDGELFVALYLETYADAVYFDLSQAEKSLIGSVPGAFPTSMSVSEEVLAKRAFQIHARNQHLSVFEYEVEEIAAIPRCLQAFGIGGTEDTCAVVVFQQPSAPHRARV